MTDVDALIAFVRARLDEHEAQARRDLAMVDRASGGGQWVTRYGYNHPSILTVGDVEVCRLVATRDLRHPNGLPVDGDDEDTHTQDAALVGRLVRAARGRAERAIRDIEAKRRIVEAFEWSYAYAHADQEFRALHEAVRLLASIDSDHSDFREEWRP